MLFDTSRATTAWTPCFSSTCTSLPHWGRANAIAASTRATSHSAFLAALLLRLTAALSLAIRSGSPSLDTAALFRYETQTPKRTSAGTSASRYR